MCVHALMNVFNCSYSFPLALLLCLRAKESVNLCISFILSTNHELVAVEKKQMHVSNELTEVTDIWKCTRVNTSL